MIVHLSFSNLRCFAQNLCSLYRICSKWFQIQDLLCYHTNDFLSVGRQAWICCAKLSVTHMHYSMGISLTFAAIAAFRHVLIHIIILQTYPQTKTWGG